MFAADAALTAQARGYQNSDTGNIIYYGLGLPAGLAAETITGEALLGLASKGISALRGVNAAEGTQLFRVFGDEARGLGNYYTTVDPSTVADYRITAGMYSGNSGQFVLEGTLNDAKGVTFTPGGAAPGPGGVGGGLPEVIVRNPATQITITNVSGVNPPF